MNKLIKIPSKGKTKLIHHVNEKTWHQLKVLATLHQVSLSEMLKIVVTDFLKNNQDQKGAS